MPRFIKKRTKKIGMPPGTLIHVGEKREERVRIRILDYDEAGVRERDAATVEECFEFKDKPSVTWINVDGIHETQILEKLGSRYNVHPLILEDILNTDQRPKLEDFGEYVYIVLKMLSLSDEENEGPTEVRTEQISLILGSNFVISFQEREGDIFEPIRERIRSKKERIRLMGADYLAYALLDTVVDQYFAVLERMGEEVESLESDLVDNPNPQLLQTLHRLKREMIFLRRAVWPLREVISGLERGEASLVKESTRIYLKDVYDHTIHVLDTVETLREMLSSMLDIYLSSTSNRMNEVMKVLTIIATIFIPLTFVVGVYGMNFEYMPELTWHWGYFSALFIMFLIGISMVIYFKRKKWI